jgi:queuine tRNA-ribosyltransferase
VPEIEDIDYIDNTLNLKDKEYKFDQVPIMEDCSCEACREYSRGYIHHLLEVNEMTAYVLLTKHNVHIMYQLLDRIRQAKEAQELSYLYYYYNKTQCS